MNKLQTFLNCLNFDEGLDRVFSGRVFGRQQYKKNPPVSSDTGGRIVDSYFSYSSTAGGAEKTGTKSRFTNVFLYFAIPVPAGMTLPMITFSFRPRSSSSMPLMAASVSTRVVSWNDAADTKLSVVSDAFVMPRRSGLPWAGAPPSVFTLSFSSWKAIL